MKNNCIRNQRREHAFLRRFWAPAFRAAVAFTGGPQLAAATVSRLVLLFSKRDFAAGLMIQIQPEARWLPPMCYRKDLACRECQKGLSPWKIRQARLRCLAS
jgi:hypothetical protein